MRWKCLGIVLVTVGCDGSSIGMPGSSEIPGVTCFTSYFSDELKAGCSPPSNLAGPFPPPVPGLPDSFHVEWGLYIADKFLPSVVFASYPYPGRTAEDAASFEAQLAASLGDIVLKYEQIALFSGEIAWLVATQPSPNVLGVQTIVVRNQRLYSVSASGSDLDGTFDLDYLTGICRTLCVE